MNPDTKSPILTKLVLKCSNHDEQLSSQEMVQILTNSKIHTGITLENTVSAMHGYDLHEIVGANGILKNL